MTSSIAFTLDGQPALARPGESILQAAERHGVLIPRLCYSPGLRPDGNCRACVVEIAGERALAPSCCRSVTPGMVVQATSARAVTSQNLVLELLLSDLSDDGHKWNDGPSCLPAAASAPPALAAAPDAPVGQHGELSAWAARQGVTVRPALQALRRESPAPDLSHPAMAVNLDACIQCTRCVRARSRRSRR